MITANRADSVHALEALLRIRNSLFEAECMPGIVRSVEVAESVKDARDSVDEAFNRLYGFITGSGS